MKVINFSGWERECYAAGKKYVLPAFSEVDIYRDDHAIHICSNYRYMGIIDLEFTEGKQQEYKTFDAFKRGQEIKALTELLKWQEELYMFEKNGLETATKTPAAANEMRFFNVDKFKKNVELIKEWLDEAGYTEEVQKEAKAEVVTKRPAWNKKPEISAKENDLATKVAKLKAGKHDTSATKDNG